MRARPSLPVADPTPPLPHRRCTSVGCGRGGPVRCSYVDLQLRACPTAWCGDHAASVAGAWLCRRHASTLLAMGSAAPMSVAEGAPELDNRAPSLAGWMGEQLDALIRELFARAVPAGTGTLVAEPVRLVLTPGGTTRRWAKTWRLVHHNTIVSRVSIEVDEADDCQVEARVDSERIGYGVPPWIEHRRAGHRVAAAVDAGERAEFAAAMARSIELVVTGQEAVRDM